MSHDPTTTSNGPWRILILDPDRSDPKWILATVTAPRDVIPAWPTAVVDEVTAEWVATASGLYRPAFAPMRGAHVWRVDEGEQR